MSGATAALGLAAALAVAAPEAGVEDRIGARMPAALEIRDEAGRPTTLGRAAAARTAVLAFAYSRCEGLCPMTLDGLERALRPIRAKPGADFTVLVLSFDPRDGAAENTARRGERPAWRFLSAPAASARRLASILGFRYSFDSASGQYAHPSVLYVFTPDGRLSRVLPGPEPAPRDLEFALLEASEGRLGRWTERAWLFCYRWDPEAGRYTPAVLRLLRAAAAAALLGSGLLVLVLSRRREGP